MYARVCVWIVFVIRANPLVNLNWLSSKAKMSLHTPKTYYQMPETDFPSRSQSRMPISSRSGNPRASRWESSLTAAASESVLQAEPKTVRKAFTWLAVELEGFSKIFTLLKDFYRHFKTNLKSKRYIFKDNKISVKVYWNNSLLKAG